MSEQKIGDQGGTAKAKASRPHTRKPLSNLKVWWLTVPVLTFILAVFYGEGRLYHEAYLRRLGLNPSLFAPSTPETYWYALNSWGFTLGKIGSAFFDKYRLYLSKAWLPALIIIVMMIPAWFSKRIKRVLKIFFKHWMQRVSEAAELYGIASQWRWIKQRRPDSPGLFTYLASMLASLFALPLTVYLAVVVLTLLLGSFVLPWDLIGQRAADDDCQNLAIGYPLVEYAGDRLDIPYKGPTARLIQCNADFCALIRRGETFAIPRTSVQWVGFAVATSSTKASIDKIRKEHPERSLCYKPVHR